MQSVQMLFSSPNVIACRVRRPADNDQMQNVPVSSDHESDGSDLQRITSPALSLSPANPVYADRSAGSNLTTFCGRTTNMAQQAVEGPMPMAGSTLQASTLALSAILEMIDRNVKGIASLKLRLVGLSNYLRNVPTTRDPVEQLRRDSLNMVLQETVKTLGTIKKLLRFQIVAGQGIKTRYIFRVTQAIIRCSNSIREYLLEYMFVAQKRIQTAVMRTVQSPMVHIKGCVMVVDATGCRHQIPLYFCTSYQQLVTVLAAVFEPDTDEAQLQRLLLHKGRYDLCINHSAKVTELTSRHWEAIEADTTITMRAVIPCMKPQQVYYCHFCNVENITSSINLQSVDCQRCGRQFQVYTDENSIYRNERPVGKRNYFNNTVIKSTRRKRNLIRNFRAQTMQDDWCFWDKWDEWDFAFWGPFPQRAARDESLIEI